MVDETESKRKQAIKEEQEKSQFAKEILEEYEKSGQPIPAFNVDALYAQKKEQEKIKEEQEKEEAKRPKKEEKPSRK